MTADQIAAEMLRIYDAELTPLYRTLKTRRLEVRAEARRTGSRAGYAELTALRNEIARLNDRTIELRALLHSERRAELTGIPLVSVA